MPYPIVIEFSSPTPANPEWNDSSLFFPPKIIDISLSNKSEFSNITFTRVLKKRWMYLSTKYWTQMGVSNQQIRLLVFRIVGICNLYMLVWYLTIFDRMRVSCSHRDGINLSYSLVVVVGTDCNLEWDAPNNMATIQVSVNAICPILAIAEALQCTGNVHTS